MNDIWKILGIPRTDDQLIIKKAYRSKLKECNPEDKPKEFMALREAYEAAIHYVNSLKDPELNVAKEKCEDEKKLLNDEERILKLVEKVFIYLELFGEASAIKRFKQIITTKYFNYIQRQRIIEYYIKIRLMQFQHWRDLPKQLIMLFSECFSWDFTIDSLKLKKEDKRIIILVNVAKLLNVIEEKKQINKNEGKLLEKAFNYCTTRASQSELKKFVKNAQNRLYVRQLLDSVSKSYPGADYIFYRENVHAILLAKQNTQTRFSIHPIWGTLIFIGVIYLVGSIINPSDPPLKNGYSNSANEVSAKKANQNGIKYGSNIKAEHFNPQKFININNYEESLTKASDDANHYDEKGRLYDNLINYKKAIYWFKKSAEAGDTQGMDDLASMYEYGRGTNKNYQKANYWYLKAARLGDAEAENNLGANYLIGNGVKKDYSQAFYWFKKSAEAGDVENMYGLALMYEYGKGTNRNYQKANYWYLKAAKLGNSKAEDNLGWNYYDGFGLKKNYSRAFYWFKKSAEAGGAEGMDDLASMYEYGRGTNKNYQKANYWYLKAARLGDAEAQNNLGANYAMGDGFKENYLQAFYWFKKSAEAGDAQGMANLATGYEYGYGTNENYQKATYWYHKAAKQGNREAINFLKQSDISKNGVRKKRNKE